jgi:HPt (histidine-containing phosphotransfer) domain-containing protein
MTSKEGNEFGFDLRFLYDFCDGEEALVQYFFHKFSAQFPLELEQLEAAIGAEDRQGVHRCAHTIRPQLDFVGLHKASIVASELQHAARGEMPFAGMKELAVELKALWEKVNRDV